MTRPFYRPRSALRLLLVVALSALLAPEGIVAQTSTGSIRGYVRTDEGAPVAGAVVAARHIATNAERSALTNESGFYFLAGLRPGEYEVRVEMLGFATQARTSKVDIGSTHDMTFQLAVEAIEVEGIEVVAEPEVETKTSEVASNVSTEQIENLPLKDRNFLDLARLAPGVRSQKSGDIRKTFASGAEQAEQINVFIDGASYKNDVLEGGVAGQDASRGNPFGQGAIQEFRVITQNYKAEYQKAASAIITATTKSGTNNWEAGGFLYHVCDGCVGKDAFLRRTESLNDTTLPSPDFTRTQLGLSLGGPIARDKLFFFGNYEGNLRDEPSTVTPGNVALFPEAAQYAGTFDTEFRQHLFFGKLTYVPSDRHTFDVSLNIRDESDRRGFGDVVNSPQVSREAAENVKINVNNVTANHTYATGQWLNEAQVNVQWFNWNPEPLNPDLVGRNFQGVIRIGGRDTRQEFTQRRIGFRDDISYAGVRWMGDHVFKAGASVDFLYYEAIKEFNGNPLFQFNPGQSVDVPFEANFGFGDPQIDANNTQFGVYVQDDWAVNRNLVLNLGVRWDVETDMINNDYVTPQPVRDSLSGPLADQLLPAVAELGGLDEYFTDGDDRSPYLGAIQPRIGASYDLFADGRTVIFGGFGIYHDRDFWNMMLDEQFRRQYRVLRIQFNETGPTEECPACVQWDPAFLDRDALRALAESGQAGAPEVFLIRNDTKPPKTHQFSLGLRQALGAEIVGSLTYTGRRGFNGFAYTWGARNLFPTFTQAYSNVLISTDEVKTWYDAFLVELKRPLRGESRLGGSLAYSLSWARQQGDFFFSLDDRFPTPSDYPKRASGADQRHSLVANAIVRLPYDFLFSTLVDVGSGFPFFGTDATLGFGPDERRTIIFRPDDNWRSTVDVRLEKTFGFGVQSATLVADMFNVFNADNFGCYNVFIPPAGEENPNFGQPGCADEGRRFQIGVRYGFGARR